MPITPRGGQDYCNEVDELIFLPIQFYTILQTGQSSIPLLDFQEAIDDLNIAYQSNGSPFRFYGNCNIDLNKNSDLANISNWWEAYWDLYQPDHAEDVINIYLADDIDNGGSNGVYFEVGDFICIRKNRLLTSTLAHEIGHFLGLDHTFRNSLHPDLCYSEFVSRSRTFDWPLCGLFTWGKICASNGDALCDTPADAQNNGTSSCTYFGPPSVDVFGDSYVPSTTNFMSYFQGCRSTFTNGQKGVMLYNLLSTHSELLDIDRDHLNPDKYEPDNEDKIARAIKIGESQCHSMNEYNCRDNEDWLVMTAIDIIDSLFVDITPINGSNPVSSVMIFERNIDGTRGPLIVSSAHTLPNGDVRNGVFCSTIKNAGLLIQILHGSNTAGKYKVTINRSINPRITNNNKSCLNIGDQLFVSDLPANSQVNWYSFNGIVFSNSSSNPTTITAINGPAPYHIVASITNGNCHEKVTIDLAAPGNPPPTFTIEEYSIPCKTKHGFKAGHYVTNPSLDVTWSVYNGVCNPTFGSETYVTPLVDDDWITVVATYNDPCTASTYELKHVYITDCSGLEERIIIYPNPSNGIFYVTMADPPILTGSHITITDQFNAIKYHTQTDSDINNIQVTLPAGMYYLNWYGADFNYSRLIFINN